MTQSELIEKFLEECLDTMTDKEKIYDKIQFGLGVPRPTVRRVASNLRKKYQQRIEQLEAVQK